MYRQEILEMIKTGRESVGAGHSLEDIRLNILPELLKPLLKTSEDFLIWVREDREYSWFYYEVQESGVCAKPAEAVAMILEAIVMDALE